MLSLIAFCLSWFPLLVTGESNFTNCPTNPLCVSVPVSYECSINASGAAALRWRVFDATGGLLGEYLHGNGVSVGNRLIASKFNANLTSAGGPIVSDLTFTPTMDIENYIVECEGFSQSGFSFLPLGINTNCSIPIEDIIPAPVPDELMIDRNYFNFSWTPQSTGPCFSSYLVFVNSSASNVTYTTTDASLIVPISESLNDTEYSIGVVAVDTGGRYMNSQGIETFTPNVPQAVSVLLGQTSPDDDDDTVNITVSWNEPPSSSRPNVSDYIIYHNVTDPDTSITIPAPTTTYNIPDATVGSVYTVGVAAVNVLGTGPIVSAIISILSTAVVPTSSSRMVSSSSMTVTPSSPSSFSSSTITPITSSTPTNGTTAGGTDNTMYIGIGVGVALIVIGILIFIIVGCLIWRKPWKGEKANFNQRRDSTEPIALVDKKDHGSSPATGQPIYQEAMSSEDIQREAAPTTGELYAQPNKGSVRRPPPQPQSELATYQDPSTIQRTQAPNMEYLYAEVDKSKPQQQQAVYAQVDKEKKGGDGTVYADLDLKNTQGGPVTGSNPANVIYSDVHNN